MSDPKAEISYVEDKMNEIETLWTTAGVTAKQQVIDRCLHLMQYIVSHFDELPSSSYVGEVLKRCNPAFSKATVADFEYAGVPIFAVNRMLKLSIPLPTDAAQFREFAAKYRPCIGPS